MSLINISIYQNMSINPKSQNVKVFIRLRPNSVVHDPTPLEPINDKSIKILKDERVFSFDKIFQDFSTQDDVYRAVAFPLVEQALNGYNGTILAYGQSGTGKTFTIFGTNTCRGIVPNVLSHIFRTETRNIGLTALEIYNEEVRDLLNYTGIKLEIRENPDYGIYVKNLTKIMISSEQEALNVISDSLKRRVRAATNLNTESSRSHTIFTIILENSKLNLVDLAGSERVSKSMAAGDRLKEAASINLSLSVLGNVISALVDRTCSYIPYRNSKLTRLLQDSLGGNCMTSIIATINSNVENFEETLCTLMYADRAKKIKNIVMKNVETSVSMMQEICRLQQELDKLTRKPNKKTSKFLQQIDATEKEKHILQTKIETLQWKLKINDDILREKARIQLQTLEEANHELTILDSSHDMLETTLQDKTQEKEIFAKKSLSLQEEDALLDLQIEAIENKINRTEKLLFKKDNEYQNEISNLLYTNKCLAKDLWLSEAILEKNIDTEQLKKIKKNIFWDEDIQECRLNMIAYCGNNMKKIELNVDSGIKKYGHLEKQYKRYRKNRDICQ